MTIVNKREAFVLLVGDLLIFFLALWVTLLLRYLEFPDYAILNSHIQPFSILFVIWIAFFYIAGLYEKHTVFLRNKLPSIILNTQILNSLAAVSFFYLIPFFGITPKTNLFIYLVVSFGMIVVWRLFIFPKLFFRKKKFAAILIGSGDEMKQLKNEVNQNDRYGFSFVRSIDVRDLDHIDFQREVLDVVYSENVSLIAVDMRDPAIEPIVPQLYNLIFCGVQFIDTHKVYESIFDRIPLSIIGYSWFIENISSKAHVVYDTFKRVMDVIVSFIFGIFTLIFYPFVIFAIWLEDKKSPFIVQERVGKAGKKIYLYKFRTMTKNNDRGGWPGDEGDTNKITKIGAFLRKSRIDEFPQLWNILNGDISLIGPRPDIIGNFETLREQIPYYTIRNVVKPGLSGWAQTHQDIVPHSIEETKERLAYDLYYIKNRSFILDVKIMLQTIKTLLSRVGK
jgi:lipopolysaccharide/colanic/teichoic acid biosynthesis glycosyltransferase